MACSVMRVLGAEVPLGSWLTWSTIGWTHPLASLQVDKAGSEDPAGPEPNSPLDSTRADTPENPGRLERTSASGL